MFSIVHTNYSFYLEKCLENVSLYVVFEASQVHESSYQLIQLAQLIIHLIPIHLAIFLFSIRSKKQKKSRLWAACKMQQMIFLRIERQENIILKYAGSGGGVGVGVGGCGGGWRKKKLRITAQ